MVVKKIVEIHKKDAWYGQDYAGEGELMEVDYQGESGLDDGFVFAMGKLVKVDKGTGERVFAGVRFEEGQ